MSAQQVEIKLRIPEVKEALKDGSGYPINTQEVRFIRRIQVQALPKPGDTIPLATMRAHTFFGTVVRAEWDERKEMFVVACQYSLKSISMAGIPCAHGRSRLDEEAALAAVVRLHHAGDEAIRLSDANRQ